MSKEIVKPEQFARINFLEPELPELNEDQKKELSNLYHEMFDKLKAGQLLTGKVISVDSNGVLVDIQYKSNGLIPKYEFSDYELKNLKPNAEIDVILEGLEGPEGNVVLSYEKAKELRAWDKIIKLFQENKPVEGLVTHTVKGGLSVDVGVPAFLPGSQIDVQKVNNFDNFVGQTVQALIIKVNKRRGNVILSRRKFISDQRNEARRKVMDILNPSQVIQGVVKNITNYGAFVDVGGVDGLLHITDMTWGRINHPSEIIKVGDTITVQVLQIDKDNNKISLGMKQLTENPWSKLSDSVQIGSKIKGKITNIADYGMFVEVEKGIEGLVHISEVSWVDRVADLNKIYKVGQEIEAIVTALDKENRRMSLSIKQLEEDPWKAINDKFKVGQTIKGTISNITDFGIFIQLLPGVDGLAHISDLSWTEHIEHPSNKFMRGQEVEAVILSIDEANKKVALGLKQLTQDPWEKLEEEYKVGQIVEGEVTKIASFGAFVRLPNGIEGLVHSSESEEGKKLDEVLKVGEKKQFRIININKNERKISLSLKLEEDKSKSKSTGSSTKTVHTRPMERVTKESKPKKIEKVKREARPDRVDRTSTRAARSSLQIELEKLAERTKAKSKETAEQSTETTAKEDENV